MPQYTINLTEAEDKALGIVALDQSDWIQNVVHNRCRVAIDEIVAAEVERITASGGTLSGTKDDIVLAAPIKSAAQRQAEYEAEMAAKAQGGQA